MLDSHMKHSKNVKRWLDSLSSDNTRRNYSHALNRFCKMFSITPDQTLEWETKEIDGVPVEHRTVKKVKLFDVGPVTFPAEEQTSVIAKSVQAVFEKRMAELEESKTAPGGPESEGGGDGGLESEESPQFTSREASLRLKQYEAEMGRGS